ncbi:hypothetical protein NLI96_g12694 [Meripilus lineatus]|uniref:Uncharacterized protein n=1 Tax=Meripilus lineatus TaxID=2056292 RepID=A0AAD5UPI0_9APHY|nr:hypothetical protein NLI96_g12694 [Physisporinus lineatus]
MSSDSACTTRGVYSPRHRSSSLRGICAQLGRTRRHHPLLPPATLSDSDFRPNLARARHGFTLSVQSGIDIISP